MHHSRQSQKAPKVSQSIDSDLFKVVPSVSSQLSKQTQKAPKVSTSTHVTSHLSNSTATTRLSTTIDPDLVRAVRPKHVLRCCGAPLSTATGSIAVHEADYHSSESVSELDDFISHSWSSNPWLKFLCFLLIYNSLPAYVASLVVGAVVMVMQLDLVAVLPKSTADTYHSGGKTFLHHDGQCCILFCPMAFALVLFFWQRMRELFCCTRRPRRLFVDRFCVDQVHEDKKTAAIRGLAAFLNLTHRFIILWSERYFSRLWCVFEIASWLHLKKPLDSILFLPIHRAGIVFSLQSGFTSFYVLFRFSGIFQMFAMMVNVVIILFVLLPYTIHVTRAQIRCIQSLPMQLESFSLDNVTCFCCSVNHRMLDTGEYIRCDRELVLRTIAGWFIDENGLCVGQDRALSYFESSVRHHFSEWILARAGPSRFPYQWLMLVSAPVVWHTLDIAAGIEAHPDWAVSIRLLLLEYAAIAFAVIPLWVKAMVQIVILSDRIFRCEHTLAHNLSITLINTFFAFFVLLALWFPLTFLNSLASPLPIAIWDVVLMLLTLLSCSSRGIWPRARKSEQTNVDPASEAGRVHVIAEISEINGAGACEESDVESACEHIVV